MASALRERLHGAQCWVGGRPSSAALQAKLLTFVQALRARRHHQQLRQRQEKDEQGGFPEPHGDGAERGHQTPAAALRSVCRPTPSPTKKETPDRNPRR